MDSFATEDAVEQSALAVVGIDPQPDSTGGSVAGHCQLLLVYCVPVLASAGKTPASPTAGDTSGQEDVGGRGQCTWTIRCTCAAGAAGVPVGEAGADAGGSAEWIRTAPDS